MYLISIFNSSFFSTNQDNWNFQIFRCDTWWNPVLPRHHPVRGNVRPDHPGAHLHDPRLQGGVQGRHLPRDSHHHPPGSLRDVLRLRHLRHLRVGKERHPASVGKLLPHAATQRGDLAHWGHANSAEIHIHVLTVDPSHHVPQIYDDEGLVHGGAGRLLRIYLHDSLDSAVPDY